LRIAIDPSLSGTAICIKNSTDKLNYRLIGTQKNKELPPSVDYTMRLMELRDEVKKTIDECKGVEFAAIEGMSFGSVGRLAELGGLSYFIREVLVEKKIPFIVIPPTVVKKYWTGKGNSPKIDMIREAVSRNLEIPYTKKFKGEILPDDNCVDSTAIMYFLEDFLAGKLIDIEDRIERFAP
jgi:Holliday junction resolvasome RuvABC endonuclease subunit